MRDGGWGGKGKRGGKWGFGAEEAIGMERGVLEGVCCTIITGHFGSLFWVFGNI